MNIVLSTDNNFVQHCAVTMVSILENNKDVSFFIITDGLTDSNSLILSELAKKYDSSLQFLLVDKSIVSRLPMPDNSWQIFMPLIGAGLYMIQYRKNKLTYKTTYV